MVWYFTALKTMFEKENYCDSAKQMTVMLTSKLHSIW